MIALSACIEMLFKELPFEERIAAAAEAGLTAVEFWRFADKDLDAINAARMKAGMAIAGIVCDTGGPLVDPANREALPKAVEESLAAAKLLDCKTMIVTTGQERPGVSRAEQHGSIVEGLKLAAPAVERAGVTLVLEPLNILVNHKGYYLSTTAEGVQILDEVGSPNVKLLYDVYHQQITEGNLIDTITANAEKIGHFHVADVPGRNQPGTGEINYDKVFEAIARTSYSGHVGLEFRATVPEKEALALVLKYASQHFCT